MFKLYYAPGSCSISPHIALAEAGLPFELHRVDFMRGKALDGGGNLVDVNPRGYVPALVLEDGELVTEGAAIVQYLADLRPETKLAPPAGTMDRVRLQEWLVFIATELHKGLGPLFYKESTDEVKEAAMTKLRKRFAELEAGLTGRDWLVGDTFTVADGYAFYALRTWHVIFKQPLSATLGAYFERILARPAVRAALAAEGFTKLAA